MPNCNSKLVDDRRRCFFFNFSYDEIHSIADVFEKSILCEYGANQLSGCGPRIHQTKTDPVENIQMNMRMNVLKTDCIPIQFT